MVQGENLHKNPNPYGLSCVWWMLWSLMKSQAGVHQMPGPAWNRGPSRSDHHGDTSTTRNTDAGDRTRWGEHAFLLYTMVMKDMLLHLKRLNIILLQGYQISLKSSKGPIDVFICPEDSSGVCSPVTDCSPAKSTSQSPPQSQPALQEVTSTLPSSSPLPLGNDSG